MNLHFILLIIILFAFSSFLKGAHPTEESAIDFRQLTINEVKIAREEKKYLFIDFYASWCAPCKKMEDEVFTNNEVARYLNENFISVRIDVNGYSDIIGGKEFNFELSKRPKIFYTYSIPYVPKPYGLDNSKYHELNEKYGNAWDRKVRVIVHYVPKGLNTAATAGQ